MFFEGLSNYDVQPDQELVFDEFHIDFVFKIKLTLGPSADLNFECFTLLFLFGSAPALTISRIIPDGHIPILHFYPKKQ